MLYLTPGQYRAMNFGFKTDDLIDSELAPELARASADANSFCQVPGGHNFLGGVIVGETHTWRVDPYDIVPQRRVYPYHRPVLSIQHMHIHATPTQYLNFDDSELHYEPSEGWIEPASASLTSYGLFGSSVLPFVGLTNPYAQLDYTYGWALPMVEQAFYMGGGQLVWRTQTGFWTSDPVVVQKNGVTVDPNDYTLGRREGTITWTVNNPNGTDEIEVSFVTKLPLDISLATGIIATERLLSKGLITAGVPAGIRSFHVAEVSVDRGMTRGPAPTTDIPLAAQEKLGAFVYYPLAFG